MQANETLQSVRKILRAGAYLAFNLPNFYSTISTDLRTLMRQVAQEEFDISLSAPTRRLPCYTVDEVRQRLANNGFVLKCHKRIEYKQSNVAHRAFCTVPIMTEATLPGIDYETRLRILERACNRRDPTANYKTRWDYYLAEVSPE